MGQNLVSLEKRLASAKKTFSKFLDPQETIIWADGFSVVLTDVRLISFKRLVLEALLLNSSHSIVVSLPIGDIDLNTHPQVSASSTQISLKNGKTVSIGLPMSPDQVDEFMTCLASVAVNPKIIGYLQTVTPEIRDEIRDRAKVDSKSQKEAENNEFQEKYGQVVVSSPFATKWITIYSKGYVKVSSGMGALKGDVEKLLDIFGETDITRKSGLGRTAGAVLTLGANVLLSPGQRGNVYLTIATDRNTHSIMWTRPTALSIRTMNEIVSAGKAAMARAGASLDSVSNASSQNQNAPDLASQLASLAQLRDSGVLSEEEFEKAKGKLLS